MTANTKLRVRFSKPARHHVGGQQKSEKGMGLLELGGEAAQASMCSGPDEVHLYCQQLSMNKSLAMVSPSLLQAVNQSTVQAEMSLIF